jgi:hypothetical protein
MKCVNKDNSPQIGSILVRKRKRRRSMLTASMYSNSGLQILQHSSQSRTKFCELVLYGVHNGERDLSLVVKFGFSSVDTWTLM